MEKKQEYEIPRLEICYINSTDTVVTSFIGQETGGISGESEYGVGW